METLFVAIGAPFYRWQGRLYVEDQTISGLGAWSDNFDRVITCANTFEAEPPPGWSDPWAAGLDPERVEIVELPYGYDLKTYFREKSRISGIVLEAMKRANYRVIGIGGWLGDWGVVCAELARRHGLPHACWFDRVESQVIAASARAGLAGRLIGWIKSVVTARNEKAALAGAELALLNGKTVLDRFTPLTRNPHLMADIHIDEDDRIAPDALQAKKSAARNGPLKVCYAGRATAMKGPGHWLDALEKASAEGANVEAVWLGDGDMLDAMRTRIDNGPLRGKVELAGFVSDRTRVLNTLRASHALMFCHITDESPRILVEALHAGTPLLGFRDPYAGSLIDDSDGGILVPRGDSGALAAELVRLDGDRDALCALIDRAAGSARHLTRSRVFAERAKLIRTYLKTNKGSSS